ncbi:MAG: ATP-binding protein [Chloroflexota bacterium]
MIGIEQYTDKLLKNRPYFRVSGQLLAGLSTVLLLTIIALVVLMLNQTQSLQHNVRITERMVNTDIHALDQVQQELLRLHIALINDSDNTLIDAQRDLVTERVDSVVDAYDESILDSEVINRIDMLVDEWETDIELFIQDFLDADGDSVSRDELITMITDMEVGITTLVADVEDNRITQGTVANDAATNVVRNAQFTLLGLAFITIGYISFMIIAMLSYLRFDRQREQANLQLQLQEDRLRSLLKVATQANILSEQFDEVVEQGTKSLGMQVGIISRVIADGYIILHAYAPEHAIADGMSCDLDATLCKRTIESASILAVPDISSIMDITSPCFDALMPKSYIGTPLTVDGRLYGTLSFVSEEQRDTGFSESDQDFVQIMAEWIAISLERQQNRDELATYASNLEKSNVELEQFAYAASHDLQEPLRKIQTFGSRLESKYGDKLEGRGLEYLTRMQSAAGRMQALIQDLLSLSRVTTQAQPLEKIDLNDVIDEVLVDIEVQVSKANAEICVSELPIIEADKTQMRQLFQNLITNAIKFAREDIPPSVVIESQLHTSTAILEVEISVSDNGIGFEPRYAERIFSVFQRLHGRGEYEGTGVGLALCRKIVERHNGTIIARGKPNEGATFVITLPVDNVNV